MYMADKTRRELWSLYDAIISAYEVRRWTEGNEIGLWARIHFVPRAIYANVKSSSSPICLRLVVVAPKLVLSAVSSSRVFFCCDSACFWGSLVSAYYTGYVLLNWHSGWLYRLAFVSLSLKGRATQETSLHDLYNSIKTLVDMIILQSCPLMPKYTLECVTFFFWGGGRNSE